MNPRLAPDSVRPGYTPLPWTSYFEQDLRLSDSNTPFSHHVYLSPPTSPTAPLFVMHHGAGSSGLTFAACAAEMRKLAPEIGVLSVDARGHGDTTLLSKDSTLPVDKEVSSPGALNAFEEHKMARKLGHDKDGVLDMSLEVFARDLEKVLKLVMEKMGWKELPNLVLVGHSLGGAVITHVAKEGRLGNKVLAYAVLDVVEGSAMDALQSMQTYLSIRPKTFPSIEAAIEWHLRSRTVRTAASARISVPSLLRETLPSASPPQSPSLFTQMTLPPDMPPNTSTTTSDSTSATSTNDSTFSNPPPTVDTHMPTESQPPPPSPTSQTSPISKTAAFIPLIPSTSATGSEPATAPRYTWRTDLRSTAPFWENWFTGLSGKFLSARGGKLLLLAGTDRLDKELMIGQMQGKYQLQVYPDAGHFLHEDLPQKTATALVDFWKRNDGRLSLPPKIQEKLKKRHVPQSLVNEAEKGLGRRNSVKNGNA